MTLKELRMWHWKQMLCHRGIEQSWEERTLNPGASGAGVKLRNDAIWCNNQEANFHIGAVQALNDVLPGTAEQDCAAADKLPEVLTHRSMPRTHQAQRDIPQGLYSAIVRSVQVKPDGSVDVKFNVGAKIADAHNAKLLGYIRDTKLGLLERWDALMDYTKYERPDAQMHNSDTHIEAELQKFVELNKVN